MTTKRKIGCFLLGMLPLPASLLIQFLVTIPLSGFAAMGLFVTSRRDGIPFSSFSERFYEAVTGEVFTDNLQIVYSTVIIVVFGLWLGKAFRKNVRTPLKKGKSLLALLGGLVLLMIGLQYLTEVVYEWIASVSPSTATEYEELTEMAGLGDPSPLMYLYVVVLGPLAEELLFRGIAMKHFRRIMPFALANLLQAAMFGIYHMNLMQGLYTFVAGLIFGLIAEKGGNLLDSILAHMIFNLLGITGLLYLWADNPYFQFVWLPVMVLTLILGAMLLFPGEETAEA
ncbi:MAG: CPBP family intramembrane metalloprotease [Lachnospiraceae bacterium]|nr:CPBP family intramembrane metalloprotease [Lachnospiraceae bacterium]